MLVKKTTAQCFLIDVDTYNRIFVCVKETMEVKCFVMLPIYALFVRKTSVQCFCATRYCLSWSVCERDAAGKCLVTPHVSCSCTDNKGECSDGRYCPRRKAKPHDRSEGAKDGPSFLVFVSSSFFLDPREEKIVCLISSANNIFLCFQCIFFYLLSK